MSELTINLAYDAKRWNFGDAEEHAADVTVDLGGSLDEAIEDTDQHEFIIVVEDLSVGEVREGLKEVIGAAGGVSFTIEG